MIFWEGQGRRRVAADPARDPKGLGAAEPIAKGRMVELIFEVLSSGMRRSPARLKRLR